MSRSLSLICGLAMALPQTAPADVPQLINYQGMLRNKAGDAVTGNLPMTFRIYDSPNNGDILWSESHPAIEVESGVFGLVLGTRSPIPDSLFRASLRWLGVEVKGEPSNQRTRLVSAPYAFQSGNSTRAVVADLLDSLDATDFARVTHSHPELGSLWMLQDSVVYTADFWGIGRGGAGNEVLGNSAHSHVNLGVASTTGNRLSGGAYATVSGGFNNRAEASSSTISGGRNNLITYANGGDVIGGGAGNSVTSNGWYATICGGNDNSIGQDMGGWCSIGGGGRNTVSLSHKSTISAGFENSITSSVSSSIGGGSGNRVGFLYPEFMSNATIGGGANNAVFCSNGTIGGGAGNRAGDSIPWLVDRGRSATVSGGEANAAAGWYTTIGGGRLNVAHDSGSVVSGGMHNRARGKFSVVAGGGGVSPADSNGAVGSYSTVSGGRGNLAEGGYSTIGGGEANGARWAGASVIAGGRRNETWGTTSVIGGGENNFITGDGGYATIGGGERNSISGIDAFTWGTIGGGKDNSVQRSYGVIGGGRSNVAHHACVVGGGESNTAGSLGVNSPWNAWATVAGGTRNGALGQGSTVGGGFEDTASGAWATVPGGYRNSARGNSSFAAGYRAKASHTGAFVWADSTDADFQSQTTNEISLRASGGVRIFTQSDLTTGATLMPGESAWATLSDSTAKYNIRSVDGTEILLKLEQLPIKRWSYRAQKRDIEHIGPMAQDFFRVFGVGADDRYISTVDPDGVALAAIKELHARNLDLQARVRVLEALVRQIMDVRQ